MEFNEIEATRDRLRSIFRPQERAENIEPMADIVRIVKADMLTAEIVREMYQALMEARSDRDREKTESIMRDAIEVINAGLLNESMQEVDAVVLEASIQEYL